MTEKTCTRCKTKMTLDNFKPKKDGSYHNYCITCCDKTNERRHNHIYEKLVDGFRRIYNIDFNEAKKTYHKCGGNGTDHDRKRFITNFGDTPFPPTVKKCPCGHAIIKNCYVTENNEYSKIIIVGNCCVKQFDSGNKRICVLCKSPHKNRTVNKCNDCRNQCEDCLKVVDRLYNQKCKECRKNKCLDCNRPANGYLRCYLCYSNCSIF